jgi:transcription elongation factor Elf1
MTATAAIFKCSICGEPSTEICVFCTKDACVNHRCDRCKRCSDCCECDVPLSAEEVHDAPIPAVEAVAPEISEPALASEPKKEAEDLPSNDPLV